MSAPLVLNRRNFLQASLGGVSAAALSTGAAEAQGRSETLLVVQELGPNSLDMQGVGSNQTVNFTASASEFEGSGPGPGLGARAGALRRAGGCSTSNQNARVNANTTPAATMSAVPAISIRRRPTRSACVVR